MLVISITVNDKTHLFARYKAKKPPKVSQGFELKKNQLGKLLWGEDLRGSEIEDLLQIDSKRILFLGQ